MEGQGGSGALEGEVKVACVQFGAVLGDVEGNRGKAAQLCESAAVQGAKIVVLPECCIAGTYSQDHTTTWSIESQRRKGEGGLHFLDPTKAAETIAGPTVQLFTALAKKLGVYITVPLLEAEPTGNKRLVPEFYNSIVVVSPSGLIVAHYRKMLVSGDSWATKGNKVESFDTPYGRMGIVIGRDMKHALQFHRYGEIDLWALLWSNAEFIQDSHSETSQTHFQEMIPNHIKKNAIQLDYVLMANWGVDKEENWKGYGCSSIYGKDGQLLSSVHSKCGPEIVYATLKTRNPLPLLNSIPDQPHVKVAAVQMPSDLGEVDSNCLVAEALCKEAAANGAKIIVLPEAAITGYLSQDLRTNWHLEEWPISNAFPHSKDPVPYAVTVPGPVIDRFTVLSKKLGVYIAVPFVEKSYDGTTFAFPKLYNTVCLVSPKGEMVAHYRKNNPWPHPEQSWATAGTNVSTYDTEYGRVGLAICFDIHNMRKRYQPENIWALLYPIAWVGGPMTTWFHDHLPHQNLSQFNFHVIGSNWSVDHYQDWIGYGYSTIYSKGGNIIGAASSIYGSEVVYAYLPVEVPPTTKEELHTTLADIV